MADFYKKTTNYWQAVLRVGLPIIALYRGADYLIFRVEKGDLARLQYPWHFAVIMDVITVFILSTLWWSIMRSVFGKRRANNTKEVQRDSLES
jgi:hypothetical protein